MPPHRASPGTSPLVLLTAVFVVLAVLAALFLSAAVAPLALLAGVYAAVATVDHLHHARAPLRPPLPSVEPVAARPLVRRHGS